MLGSLQTLFPARTNKPCRSDPATTSHGVACLPAPRKEGRKASIYIQPARAPWGVQKPKLENYPVDSPGGTPSRPASRPGTPTPFARTPPQHPTKTPRPGEKPPRSRTPPPRDRPRPIGFRPASAAPCPAPQPARAPAPLITPGGSASGPLSAQHPASPPGRSSDGRPTPRLPQTTTWCRHYLLLPLCCRCCTSCRTTPRSSNERSPIWLPQGCNRLHNYTALVATSPQHRRPGYLQQPFLRLRPASTPPPSPPVSAPFFAAPGLRVALRVFAPSPSGSLSGSPPGSLPASLPLLGPPARGAAARRTPCSAHVALRGQPGPANRTPPLRQPRRRR